MVQKKCVSCKQIREHKAKGLCVSCYSTRRKQYSVRFFGERLQVSEEDYAEVKKLVEETKKKVLTQKYIRQMLDKIKLGGVE